MGNSSLFGALLSGVLISLTVLAAGCSQSPAPAIPEFVPVKADVLTADQQRQAIAELLARRSEQMAGATAPETQASRPAAGPDGVIKPPR